MRHLLQGCCQEGPAVKILLAEDDPIACRRLQECLTDWGYEVLAVGDGTEALRALQAPDAPQIALLDWMMPGLDGPEICREVRRRPRDRYTYILLLTAKAGADEIMAGFESGADDYLIKPFDLLELQGRLLAARRIVRLNDDLIAAREAMRHQATHDGLTGVWNRPAILEHLERELQRAGREGRTLSVILGDLDHFKHVNDTFGHLAGDAVLKEAAQRLSGGIRPYDLIGRYGGEEFVILLPGADAGDAVHCAERLRHRIAAEPVAHEGQRIDVTVSLGVAHSADVDPPGAAALLQAADLALYQAKARGRNCVVTYFPGLKRKELRPPHMADRAALLSAG
jgi:diguanylate cyclase (GGDEF)-like protein